MENRKSRIERMAKGFVGFAVPAPGSTEAQIKGRAKTITMIVMFLVAMAALAAAWNSARSNRDVVAQAISLRSAVSCRKEARGVLVVCMDAARWRTAAEPVRTAWMQGQFYRSPEALTLRTMDASGGALLQAYQRPDEMRTAAQMEDRSAEKDQKGER